MLLARLDKKFHELQRSYELLGFKRFFTSIIYQSHDELKLEKNLNEETKFSLKEKLDVKRLEEKHLSAMEDLCIQHGLGGKRPMDEFNDYLRNGSNGFVAFLSDKLIGYVWWGNNKLGFDFTDPDFRFYRSALDLEDGDVYLFDVFIDPEYRGDGNSLEFFSKIFSALNELGYKRAYGFSLADNKPARWTYKLVGFKEVERFVDRRFLLFVLVKGRRLLFDSNGHKKLTEFEESTLAKLSRERT